MGVAAAHRVRWLVVWAAIALWFAGLALNFGGDRIHLLLVAAMIVLVYELVAKDPVDA